MKKRLTALLAIVLALSLLGGTACAMERPLPPVNTDADIQFGSFEWYSDYNSVVKMAKSLGYSDYNSVVKMAKSLGYSTSALSQFDSFGEHASACHWVELYRDIYTYPEEEGTGGHASFSKGIPKVAGYDLKRISFYFMRNSEKLQDDYKVEDAVQFYMGLYNFDVVDKEAAYNDLVIKLKGLYGDSPFEGEHDFLLYKAPYTVWVNDEGGLVGVAYDKYDLQVLYMAPGAEDKIVALEDFLMNNQIAQAAGDTSGL